MRLLSSLVLGFAIMAVPASAQSGAVSTWQKAVAADVKFQQKILADMAKTKDPAKLSRLQATLAEQNRTVQQSQNNLAAAQQKLKSAPAAAAPAAVAKPVVASKPVAAKPVPASAFAPSNQVVPPSGMVQGGSAGIISGGAGNASGGAGIISGGAGNASGGAGIISGGAGNASGGAGIISGGAGNASGGGAGIISGGAGNAVPQRSIMSTTGSSAARPR
jgi:hypothetical protein